MKTEIQESFLELSDRFNPELYALSHIFLFVNGRC